MKNDIYSKRRRDEDDDPVRKKPTPPSVNVWEQSLRRQRIQNWMSGLMVVLIASLIIFIAFQQQNQMRDADLADPAPAPPPVARPVEEVATTWVRPLAPLPGEDARSGLMLDSLRRMTPFQVGDGDHPLSADALKAATWHLLQAEQARQAGELQRALDEYAMVQKIFPRVRGVYGAVGMIYLDLQNSEAAMRSFEQAILMDGASAGLLNNQAIAAIQLSQYGRAIELLSNAVQLQPNYAPAHYNLAVAYARQGEYSLASRQFREYLRLAPNDLDSMLSFAALLIEIGQWQGAAGLLTLADREAPGTPPILFRLAEARAQSGQLNEAMNALERALERVDARQALRWIGRREFDPLRDHPDFQRLLDQLGG